MSFFITTICFYTDKFRCNRRWFQPIIESCKARCLAKNKRGHYEKASHRPNPPVSRYRRHSAHFRSAHFLTPTNPKEKHHAPNSARRAWRRRLHRRQKNHQGHPRLKPKPGVLHATRNHRAVHLRRRQRLPRRLTIDKHSQPGAHHGSRKHSPENHPRNPSRQTQLSTGRHAARNNTNTMSPNA